MQYKEFIFEDYYHDPTVSTLSLRYRFAGGPRFEENLVFDFVPRQLSSAARLVLDRIFRLIFLLSGVSYYKAFVPKVLTCKAFPLDCKTAEFLQKFYEKGLAEFAFKNRVSLRDHIVLRANAIPPSAPVAVGTTLLRRVGVVDPASLDEYLAAGGYAALSRAITTESTSAEKDRRKTVPVSCSPMPCCRFASSRSVSVLSASASSVRF